LPGTWYFAPGSKSCSLRGGRRRDALIPELEIPPGLVVAVRRDLAREDAQRHLSMIRPKGRNATLSRASRSCSAMSAAAGGSCWIRPIVFRYLGVTDSARVSPSASWKPSLAPSRNSGGWVLCARW